MKSKGVSEYTFKKQTQVHAEHRKTPQNISTKYRKFKRKEVTPSDQVPRIDLSKRMETEANTRECSKSNYASEGYRRPYLSTNRHT